MNNLNELGVKSWDRFVYDKFTIIINKSLAEKIFDYLNKLTTQVN